MKLLQVNCVYREGSTGKIVACISDDLRAQGHEVFTCYGDGAAFYDEYAQKVCSKQEHNFNAFLCRLRGIPFGGLYLSNLRIKKKIKDFHPDVVHLHCINGYMVNVYRLLQYLAKRRIKTVLTLHAEIFHTAGCGHAYECDKWKNYCHHCKNYKRETGSWFFDRSKYSWKKMYKAVNGFNEDDLVVTAVSPWLTERAKQSAIFKRYHVETVFNGLNTSVFHFRTNRGLIDRQGFEKIILFVTPYFGLDENDIKGGRYILPLSNTLTNYKFVVVASKVSRIVGELPKNVQIWGRAKNQEELAQLYSEADVTLLLSRRETFSMVTVESLCCGTSVIGFMAGGPESIAPKEYSVFVDYGNVSLLTECLSNLPRTLSDKIVISQNCMEIFCSKIMTDSYRKVYSSLVNYD